LNFLDTLFTKMEIRMNLTITELTVFGLTGPAMVLGSGAMTSIGWADIDIFSSYGIMNSAFLKADSIIAETVDVTNFDDEKG
jgi:hypothetical protein